MGEGIPDSENKGVSSGPKTGLRYSWRAFGHRNYRIFWCGALASNTGSWLSNLTVPYVLYQMTGSAFWVGLVSLWQFLPSMLFGPLGGALADRYDRRLVLLFTQSGMAASALLMWASWVSGWREPLVLLALVGASGLFLGINMPSWQSFVSDLVPRDDLRSAVALNSLQFNAARALGPAIAGFLLAALGPSWAFFLNGLSFLCVLAALLLVRRPTGGRTAAAPGAGIARQFADALRYIGGRPGIVLAVVLSMLMGALANPIFQLTVVFAGSVFHTGTISLGLLNAALGAGAVLAAPLVSGSRGMSLSRAVRHGLPLCGAALIAFAAAPAYLVGLFALVAVGFGFLAVVSSVTSAVQIIVADHLRGRVIACRTMLYNASLPVGGLLQGYFSDLVGPRVTVGAAGALLLLSAAVLMRRRGRMRLDRLDDPHDDSLFAPGKETSPSAGQNLLSEGGGPR